MNLVFALFSLFLLGLNLNLRAMDNQASYTMDLQATSIEERDWAYETLYADHWQIVLAEHAFDNPWGVNEELRRVRDRISLAPNLSPSDREDGLRACSIILRIFPI